jgi:cell division protein FtsA
MATQLLGALDIGTQTTTLAAGEVEDGELRVLHVVSTPTYGVRKGVIRNINDVTKSIRKAFTEMSTRYDVDIYDVVAGLSAQDIKTTSRTGVKSFVSLAVMSEEDAINRYEQSRWCRTL